MFFRLENRSLATPSTDRRDRQTGDDFSPRPSTLRYFARGPAPRAITPILSLSIRTGPSPGRGHRRHSKAAATTQEVARIQGPCFKWDLLSISMTAGGGISASFGAEPRCQELTPVTGDIRKTRGGPWWAASVGRSFDRKGISSARALSSPDRLHGDRARARALSPSLTFDGRGELGYVSDHPVQTRNSPRWGSTAILSSPLGRPVLARQTWAQPGADR